MKKIKLEQKDVRKLSNGEPNVPRWMEKTKRKLRRLLDKKKRKGKYD